MSRNMTTWRKELTEAFQEAGEDITKMVCTLDDTGLDTEFYAGFGGSEGSAFTAWGEKYVFFPAVYDGAEWVAKAPRNPSDEATEHVGGE